MCHRRNSMVDFNKYLLSSLKTNHLLISLDDKEYIEIIDNIAKMKKLYLTELKKNI